MRKAIKRVASALGYTVMPADLIISEITVLGTLLRQEGINLAFDVGANRGQYALELRKTGYKGRIVSFEPGSEAHQQLIGTAEGDSLWTVAPRTAVGAVDGTVKLNVAGNSVSSSLLGMLQLHTDLAPDSAYTESEDVRIDTLEHLGRTYLSGSDRLLLKIDTQGYEREVLAGAAGILPKVRVLQCEASLRPLYEGAPALEEMIALGKSLGFEMFSLIPGFLDRATGALLQCDIVMRRPAQSA